MAEHGGGGGGGGRRASDSKGGSGLVKAVTGNGCLRYLALYIVALLLLVGLAVANGLGLFQKLGLPTFSAPAVASTNSTTLPASSATGIGGGGTTSTNSTASGGGAAQATGATIQIASAIGGQGSRITATTPGLPFYIVQPRDTLDSVAAKFGLTRQQLYDYNRLTKDMLLIGQVLYLPNPNNPPVPNTGRNAGGGDAAPSNAGNTDDSTP